MIAVDTNIIIRLLTRDDEAQYQSALAVFDSEDVFIADTVIQETEWVLRYAYQFSPEEICTALNKLFGLKNVQLSNPSWIAQAVRWHQAGMDFSDALHLAGCQQHEKLYTYDKKFIAKAKGLSAIPVEMP